MKFSIITFLLASFMMFSNQKTIAENPIGTFTELGYASDTFITPKGDTVNVIFIKHGSLALDIKGKTIYIDPVTMFGNDYSVLPKADVVMVTHEHHDHLDSTAIALVATPQTQIMSSARVSELLPGAKPLKVGEKVNIGIPGVTITTFPAYNTTPDHLQFHPRERGDLGFIFYIDGLKIYIAGDTEDTPEMTELGPEQIDIAFLPVNQPFTMTPEQAIKATDTIHPKILYPYHYGQTDLTPIVNYFANSDVQVRIREMQ